MSFEDAVADVVVVSLTMKVLVDPIFSFDSVEKELSVLSMEQISKGTSDRIDSQRRRTYRVSQSSWSALSCEIGI